MKTDKTKLLQDIEAMKEKLASMEKELNKPEEFRHFPSKGDTYYALTPWGKIEEIFAHDNEVRPNTYKTYEEAKEAYKKAVALEKITRRILELQGDWKPDWTDKDEEKYCIQYDHHTGWFKHDCWYTTQHDSSIPYMKNEEIALTIINELEDELELIFDIA